MLKLLPFLPFSIQFFLPPVISFAKLISLPLRNMLEINKPLWGGGGLNRGFTVDNETLNQCETKTLSDGNVLFYLVIRLSF